MYTPESVLDNEIHKIVLDFEIQTDQKTPARKLRRVLINKKVTLSSNGFCCSSATTKNLSFFVSDLKIAYYNNY